MRLIALIAAASLAAPAAASTYAAKPVAPAAAGKIIGKDISWACAGTSCTGRTDTSRPVVLCQDLAKQAGAIDQFLVDGRPIGAADLAKCNKSAKGGAPASLAKAN